MLLSSVADQREILRTAHHQATNRYRILFIGRGTNGPTDVVASLKRALVNLGHRVFHLDTGRHSEMLDKSSGARGGYGPIYLDVAAMRPVLEKFRPQVVIACAGGLVLKPRDAQELRNRGAIVIGMTLSDPDVQESVIEHVSSFDYHTTNALYSLQQYHERGLKNTLLLPFGIDRDFVLRTLPRDPSLRADAICIGHAYDRTERHEVMGALAERFNVRVYGNGWPIQDAEVVKGDRLLQAAREGTFHINFPATRAGYTNVKCGVFESVGAGAVLCTTKFDEMARLFEYDEEIIGYSDADELIEKLADLLANHENLESIRRKSFDRLLNNHLYEHRWLNLIRDVERDIESESPCVGSSRAREVEEVLSESNPEPRTVIISGYFGGKNLGDDLLLEATASGIRTHVPDADVVVAATKPKVVESEIGLPAFNRLDVFECDYWASRATAVILGPGGLWHDYTIQQAGGVAGMVSGATVSPAHLVQLPSMTVAHGGEFHVFGMGVGPLSDDAAQATVRLSGHLARSIVVRDDRSRDILERISGWSTAVDQAADIAYGLELPEQRELDHRQPYIAVNVRPWDRESVGYEELRGVLSEVATNYGLSIIGVPMQPVDEISLDQLFDGLNIPGELRVMRYGAEKEEFVRTLAGASAVVSMRLHTSLFAHRLGRPVVGIAYDPKVRAHFAELGREDYVLGIPLEADVLSKAINQAVREHTLGTDARDVVATLEGDARAALAGLGARLRDAPLRRPTSGVIERTIAGNRGARSQSGGGSGDRLRSKPERSVGAWAREQTADLKQGVMNSGNDEDPSRSVAYEYEILPGERGVRFNLAESAPTKGDYATWRLTLPAEAGKGTRLELLLWSRYREQRNRRGRIAYEVWVDGQQLFRQDVAAWRPRNTVWIARVPEVDAVNIEVRVIALRDCEQWRWGPVTAVRIEAARQMAWDGTTDLAWGASAPVFDQPEPTRDGRKSSWRLVVGRNRRQTHA